jgi:DNA helicase-2/ATP-dependent DNA helicase PcrA
MDVTPILESLNDAQRQAVTAPAEPTLVIAGAGSGKTRVLVHRAAWLIDVEGVSPQGLLAVTFTNKAAAEMRGRIEALLGMSVSHLWIGTFHGLAHRLLRRHWQEAKLPQNFQIIDSDDQLRLIKRLLKNLEIDDSRWVPKEIQWFINAQKDEGLRPQHLDDDRDPNRRQMIALYAAYQEVCERGGLVDFAELLLRAHDLWRDNPELLAHYQQRFSHLLVDEFQDTNAIQYAWLRLLAGDNAAIPFVVGDDDQSIYRWRGARVEHIHRFQRDFPNAAVVKLEQNYRSTATILNAANAVIANNAERMGKNLWTEGVARLDRPGQPACRSCRAVPFQRPVPGTRRRPHQRGNPVSRLRWPALFRARRDQGRTRLPASHIPPGRRCVIRAYRQSADTRHRRPHDRDHARVCARP